MIAIAHNFTADLDHFQVGHAHDWSDINALEVNTRHEAHHRHRHPSDEAIAHGLMKSCLSSLSAYEEIIHQANSWEIRELAQVVLRQRWAQCQALVNRTGSLASMHSHVVDSSCAEVRYQWLLALNALEDELLPLFEDHIEKAECLLEEACLDASSMARDESFAHELRDLALSICGARQCWEEITLQESPV